MPFRPAFWRGGTQPTPMCTYRGRALRGCLVGLGRGAAPLGVLGLAPGALGTKGLLYTRFFIPLKKIPTARLRAQLLSRVVPVVPSERP